MEKIIEFSLVTVWDWSIQLMALGFIGVIVVVLVASLVLLVRRSK